TAVHTLKHLLAHALPDIIFDSAIRTPVTSSGRISASRQGLTLGTPNPEAIISAIYGTLAMRKAGETLVLQAVLGRARSPEPVHPEVSDPLQ
ncbi:hypothetical protein, partial [Paraburkholderia sp. SIMBA_053]|uniref:hypothetical protein n=1 Tax=Paraburkholderia sp. SIMBA_053 TaxID=3085794 RepID=UPI00397B244C